MSKADQLRKKLAAEKAKLNALEAQGEESYNAEAQHADKVEELKRKEIARQRETRTKGKSGVGRARQLGIPASAVPRCNAVKTDGSGDRCVLPAGTGTEHYGRGRCKYHGGNTHKGTITHGRYSNLFDQDLNDMLHHFAADENPLDMTADILLVRSLVEHFINDYQDWRAAIEAWHESYNQGLHAQKPPKIMELSDVHKLLDSLAKMIDKERKARSDNAISARDLMRIINHIGASIDVHVRDEEVKKKIREEILSIRFSYR